MHNIGAMRNAFRNAIEDNQALVAVIGMIAGVLLAHAAVRYGPPESQSMAITIAQARASLLSSLGLVFTGLSIVLALTAVAAQNMSAKFSLRLLPMKLRTSGNKVVLSVFALTAAFILTSQVLIRGRPEDALAPPLTLFASLALLVVSGVMIVAYVNSSMQDMRIDRTIRWVTRFIMSAADAQQHAARHDSVVSELDIERPVDSVDLLAPDDGVIIAVDLDRLEKLAGRHDARIVIDRGCGRPVIAGETVGWMSASATPGSDVLESVVECLSVSDEHDPRHDVGYSMGVLVDTGLMALSPAVNDPHTGVQCTNALTSVFGRLADKDLGIRIRRTDDGDPLVVVRERTVGDLLDTFGRQILLYGAEDRMVTAALLRLGRQSERTFRSARDRRVAAAFSRDVQAAYDSQAPS